jgi:hypothetical protein
LKEKTLKQFENIQKNKTGKLHYLSNILRIFKLQNYLESPLTKEHRSFLSKIRISAHSLNIETGRYTLEQCIVTISDILVFRAM